MHFRFIPSDTVQICVPASPDSNADTKVLMGRIATSLNGSLTIVLRESDRKNANLFRFSVDCIVRKVTPFGLLEFEATGRATCTEKKLILAVMLLSPPRKIQRRAACRVELHSEVRYRDLDTSLRDPAWRSAKLYDISLGGASLLSQNDFLPIGRRLLVEFSLDETLFSVAAVVLRIEAREGTEDPLHAIEYLYLSPREQNRLGRAMTRLQLKIISSRIETNQIL
jgi:hypothetical protein